MTEPASGAGFEPDGHGRLRWASFTPAEANRLSAMKALYETGQFAEDDPYVLARSDDKDRTGPLDS